MNFILRHVTLYEVFLSSYCCSPEPSGKIIYCISRLMVCFGFVLVFLHGDSYVSVQYNGEFLTYIILLTLCDY